MGLFDNFFGGEKKESKPQRTSVQTPEQEKLLKTLIGQVSDRLGPAARSPQMFAPQNETEEQLFGWARSQAVKDMLQGKVPYEVGPEFAEQYYEKAIRPNMLAEWQDIVKPQIRESFAGPGYWHTDRMRQESESAEQLARDLSAKRAELMYSEELAGREAKEKAMDRILPTSEKVSQAGQYERDIEHEKVMDAVTRFLTGEEVDGQYQPANNPMMALALSLLGIQPFAVGTKSTARGAGFGYGFLEGAAEGVGSGIIDKIFK